MALLYLPSYRIWMICFGPFLALLIQAQDQSGFISIDCGADVNYTDSTTGINYISDANFINTGVSKSIESELKDKLLRQFWTVRSFPEGKRNCYKINITKGSKYLIRTNFLYGNYDGLNEATQEFDILLGANLWHTVTVDDATSYQVYEIIYVPLQDYVQICLVNTGHGKPFISTIELRTLKNNIYVTQFGSLKYFYRWDLGSKRVYRYKDDVYDRCWYYADSNTTELRASISANPLNQSDYKLPAIVMSTAITPVNVNDSLNITWPSDDPTDQFFVYVHFTEIDVLPENQTREFSISLNDELLASKFSPRYRYFDTFHNKLGSRGKEIKLLLKMTKDSTLPPIINAMEIYKLIEFHQSDTDQGDVVAITTIKSVYGVTRDWQGDPCAPVAYLWDGLNCTYHGNEFPRITILNLSSSGLSGNIDPSIANLTMLEKLDLSNNSLKGEVPDFLSQLQHLKVLNLEKNNLSGSVPSALVEKYKHGSLTLSLGENVYLCESDQCNEKKKKNIVTPLVASISGVLVLLVVVAILWTLKRKKSKENDQSEILEQSTKQDDSFLQLKKQNYSYSDVLKMTNNFNTVVGKGGFGTVYLGYIDDIPVAVKILSPLSVRGYEQFQAEVKLLMRIHHKNLTSLIGYCNEGTNKSLIYEYMANGNLQEHLSGKHGKSKCLSWEDRLRIAVDSALGLEYLHTGCKPPIIHRDVKSTNILLNEHFQAKISDFGLSKIIPTEGEHVSTVVAGTPGYLDPEYSVSNRLTEKMDVYSFGVVLLEIITSQPVIGRNEEMTHTHITQWFRSLVTTGDIKGIVDSRLEGDFDINSAWKAVEIAMACVAQNPNERPIMSVIVLELKEALATQIARTKHTSAADSVEQLNMNLNTELNPLAR